MDKRERERALELISNPPKIIEPVQVAGSQCDLKVSFVNENFPSNSAVKPGDKIEKIWIFKNTGDKKIPFSAKLVKMSGQFGPAEIQINKTVQPDGIFQVKIDQYAPQVGQHYKTEYQLHTAEQVAFGERVLLDFIVEAGEEESVMFENLMDSMNVDKPNAQLNFNVDGPKEERMSMMIN